MSGARRERVDVLGERVRWLDRYRRSVAIGLAALLFLVMLLRVHALFGSNVGVLASALVASVAWWLIEVGLAWLTALWETEYVQLVRDKGLPRAELILRK